MKNKKTLIISLIVIAIVAIIFGITYSFLATTVNANKQVILKAGTLDLVLDEKNEITISDALPMYDEVGMIQEEKYNFSLVNNTSQTNEYTLKLVKIEGTNELNPAIVKYGLIKEGNTTIASLSTLIDGVIDKGTIVGNDSIDYELRLWIDNTVTALSSIQGKSLSYKIVAEASTVEEEQPVTLAAGLYDENDVMLYSWDELIANGDITVSEGAITTADTGLTGKLVMDDSVTSIGDRAFAYTALTSVTIPDSVTSIGDGVFSECYDLSQITIPDSVTSIGGSAFDHTALTSVTIPSSVTSIGDAAFYGCVCLTSVTIPSSVTYIGVDAFHSCEELTSVYFEHTTAPTFGNDCFEGNIYVMCTFYFRNSTVADALIADRHYDSAYGTKSTDYNW